jgi:hypothetical protein
MYIVGVCEQDSRKISEPNTQKVTRSCSNLYEFYNLHSSLNINRISKSRMRYVDHIAYNGESKMVGKRGDPTEILCTEGKIVLKWIVKAEEGVD